MLARLASVFAEQGLNTLVVDAADTAPEPGELAFIDLGACVEPLSPQLAYLAARGLPMQHVDTHGSCASFIPRMMNVVYDVDVVVHRIPRPVSWRACWASSRCVRCCWPRAPARA